MRPDQASSLDAAQAQVGRCLQGRRGRMTPPTRLRRLALKRVPCGSGALRDQVKSLDKQRRANREGDYTDGLVAADAGRCLSREGMQRLLARQARQAAGFLPSHWGGK